MAHTILLVDDHPVFRQGLRHLLAKEEDLRVVGEADDGEMAIELVRRETPDLVVMDINMPNIDGIEATRQILSDCPDTRVVALSVHSGKQSVRDMIQAGALGYILKESIPEEMVEGIRIVLTGDIYLSKSISNILVSDYKTLISESESGYDELSQPLLYTKLHRPPISAGIIPRTRLIELLENGVQNPMTLIAAPAGYGKSILASQWLDVSELPGAWVSLDESDNDLRIFFSYALEAIQNVFPDRELSINSLPEAGRLPSLELIARHLLNDLETLPKRFILVLDDYHRIRNSAIHDFLSKLLKHPSSIMHLALVSRRDPPLPLTSLGSRGMLTEITSKDLRFTVSETKSFLERFLHIVITDKTAQILEEKIEGWVTGLHLAALSIRKEADQERLTDGLLETPHYLRDYLVQEVLSQVPPQFNRKILQTALLKRFCAPLCDALFQVDTVRNHTEVVAGGRDFIDWLIDTNLFVMPLDNVNRWFRYHHLFQKLLLDQLRKKFNSEEIAALHSRASEWFAENGLIDEAIQLRMAAGDTISAAQLVERNRQPVLNADRWYILEKWISMLPVYLIQQRPDLLLAKAWVLYHHFDIPRIPPVIDAAEKQLTDSQEDQSLRGEIDFFRGYFCYFQNDGIVSLKHLNDARKRVPETNHEIRGQIEILHGLATQMQGQKEDALNTLNDLLTHPQWTDVITGTRLLVTVVYIYIISGNLEKAIIANQQLDDFASRGNYTYARVWSIYLQGLIHFYRYDLEIAIKCFHRAIKEKYVLHTRASADAMAGLAFAYQAVGNPEYAIETVNSIREYGESIHDPNCSLIADSCHARLSIMQEDQKAVATFLQRGSPPVENMVWWIEVPAVTYGRALLAEGSDLSLQDAELRLQKLLKLNQTNHNILHSISILSLLAIAYQKQGRIDEALAAAGQAFNLTNSHDIIQPFVELGPPMANMLKQLIT